MRGRILAGTLVLSMVFLLGNFNQEVQAQPLGENEAGSMEFLKFQNRKFLFCQWLDKMGKMILKEQPQQRHGIIRYPM